jgi:CheY-like chemotaxis protein
VRVLEEKNGRVVLLIDDDPSVLDSFSRLLAKDGFTVLCAASGPEGLQAARTQGPDIIVLDIMMPGMDGWDVLGELKSDPRVADIPVVLLSILEEDQKGLSLGAVEYLHKPIDEPRLATVLRRYLPSGSKGRVLVVEDDPPTREAMMRLLQAVDFQTAAAGDGAEALDLLDAFQPGVIILDLLMPGMDGFQFLVEKQNRDAWRDVPLIVVSAKELSDAERTMLEDGGVERLFKKGSYAMEDLLKEVQRVVKLAALPPS